MKAIQTIYKGYKFRSRLEARWAVFFDALGIEWEYEKEGFNVSGKWYLPDFYLPNIRGGLYIEIKPVKQEWPDHFALDNFLDDPSQFILLSGSPGYDGDGPYGIDQENFSYNGTICGDTYYYWCQCETCGKYGIEWHGMANRICRHEPNSSYSNYGGVIKALTKARQARFEHGESPQ